MNNFNSSAQCAQGREGQGGGMDGWMCDVVPVCDYIRQRVAVGVREERAEAPILGRQVGAELGQHIIYLNAADGQAVHQAGRLVACHPADENVTRALATAGAGHAACNARLQRQHFRAHLQAQAPDGGLP